MGLVEQTKEGLVVYPPRRSFQRTVDPVVLPHGTEEDLAGRRQASGGGEANAVQRDRRTDVWDS